VTRFLIVRLGSLGDVVHAIPVVAALRERFPDARIDWVTDPRYVPLLEVVRGIDRRVAIDTRRIPQTIAIIRELRRHRYDAALDLQGLVKSAVLARASGARRVIGYPAGHLREPAARFFYSEMPDPGDSRHVVFKNLALLAALGIQTNDACFPLQIPGSAAVARAPAAVAADGYVLINPGAAWPNKRWPPDRFGAVAASIRDRYGMRSRVLWGPGEESLAAAVVASSSGAAELAPPTTIPDLFALASGARLIVSGDTGPLHVAAAVRTPIVALFGPTFPQRNGPWAADDVTISRDTVCICHYERRCRRDEPCINSIGVGEVMDAIARRLAACG
jgi:lipopolysaccharide heptosyltransferase I